MSPSGPTLVVLAAGRARRYGGCKPLAPVGADGEAVIDLLAGDALSAGFGTIVLVIGPSTGSAIRYHVAHRWPKWVDVRFAVQEAPLGTVHAVLSASDFLTHGSFGVANADDLYGESAFKLLACHLSAEGSGNALVGFELRNAIVGDSPVTRGVCQVGPGSVLTSVVERRQVTAVGGDRFVCGDGLEPKEIPGDAQVSMNLWGFDQRMLAELRQAMDRAEDASEESEVLLPEVVGSLTGPAAPADAPPFIVLPAPGRCIGVTHPDDLSLVRSEIAVAVASGERPARPFTSPDP
jgi:hypothetical protein